MCGNFGTLLNGPWCWRRPPGSKAPACLSNRIPRIFPLPEIRGSETPEAPFQVSLEEAEKNLVTKALEKSGGNQTRAAVLLGITRDTLRYKMKKFNLR